MIFGLQIFGLQSLLHPESNYYETRVFLLQKAKNVFSEEFSLMFVCLHHCLCALFSLIFLSINNLSFYLQCLFLLTMSLSNNNFSFYWQSLFLLKFSLPLLLSLSLLYLSLYHLSTWLLLSSFLGFVRLRGVAGDGVGAVSDKRDDGRRGDTCSKFRIYLECDVVRLVHQIYLFVN